MRADISSRALTEIRNQLIRIGSENVIHDRELPLIHAELLRMESAGSIAHTLKAERDARRAA
jgi:hypothetical protein